MEQRAAERVILKLLGASSTRPWNQLTKAVYRLLLASCRMYAICD